jgi:hypothetical protein
MKLNTICASLFLLVAASLTPVHATILVNENFDSYANTAAMTAVWGGGGLGTLDTTLSYSPSNSALHPGGTVNTYLPGFGGATPSATQDLVLSAKIYDDAVAGNDRISVGLRTGAAPLFEMGRYNAFNTPATGVHVYGIRGLSLGNGITSPAWTAFTNAGAPISSTKGWHTYVATFSITDGLSVTLDLGSDGTIDSTLHFAGNGTSAFGNFTDLRFGGPSNNSSTGGGANFDDIRLELANIVPEPASLALVSLMGIGLGCLRTRK